MNANSWLATCMAAALLAAAGASAAPVPAAGGVTFTVRNDTNEYLDCAIRKTGSGVSEELRLSPGQTWTHDYPKPKPRNFRCEGAAPVWYLLRPGVVYRMAANRDGLIVLVPAGR